MAPFPWLFFGLNTIRQMILFLELVQFSWPLLGWFLVTHSRLQSVLPPSRSLFVHLFYKTRVCGGSNGCEPYECDMRTDTRRNVMCFVRIYMYVGEGKFKDCRSYRRQTGGNLLCSPPSSRCHNSDPHI